MSVSYDRVNWADYPATTTPVNATNLNKMDKGIADLTNEVNSVESSVGNLNSSLDDIDIRYNAVSGKPEWRERGADAYVPFSSDIMFVVSSRGYNAAYFGNENEYDFSFGAAIWQKTTDYGYTSQNTGYTLVSAKKKWMVAIAT